MRMLHAVVCLEGVAAGVQATTDARPQQQPRKQGGDGFGFGNFIKGDLPGKLATILVSCHTPQHAKQARACGSQTRSYLSRQGAHEASASCGAAASCALQRA